MTGAPVLRGGPVMPRQVDYFVGFALDRDPLFLQPLSLNYQAAPKSAYKPTSFVSLSMKTAIRLGAESGAKSMPRIRAKSPRNQILIYLF
jgi:hypothetical protein